VNHLVACQGFYVCLFLNRVTCSNALNKVVLEEKIYSTNEILNTTREIVIHQLQSSEEGQLRDGMDICLIRINKQNPLQIQYSGANRPLIAIHEGKAHEYFSDKQPIGFHEKAHTFKAQDLEIASGSMLYLFTDGYADQFGGEKGRKLGSKKFLEMLISSSEKPLPEQKEYFEKFFIEWKGSRHQMDDVTLIGIKV